MTEPPMTLAALVRTKRTDLKLSRQRLGERTGTSLSSMNRLELENAVPLAPSLFRIADELDIDLQTLRDLVLAAADEREQAEASA